MPSPLATLEPRRVWQCFDAIRRIPRPSKHEEKISAHVRAWAEGHGFDVRADTAGNLVVVVPATPGHESAPIAVLQAHLDMVCEKNADVEHDFFNDPIEVDIDGDWVVAKGTTLGADNGLGAAAAMAMAEDPDLTHGPLELLFTLDEETGLNGASALDPSIVEGRLLINLDTEEDGAFYIGCAGAAGIEGYLPLERGASNADGETLRLSVRGLRGGHSGVEIGEGRGNAIKIATRALLTAVDAGLALDLLDFDGGGKRNAIPREAFAELRITSSERQRLDTLLDEVDASVREQLGNVEPDFRLELKPIEAPDTSPLTAACRNTFLRTLAAIPAGILEMSNDVPGLVETSNNLAAVSTTADRATVLCSFRSSVNAALTETMQSLRAIFRLAGAEVEEEAGYPGWKPNPDSPLVRRAVEAHMRALGEEPEIKAVHAGLECGILGEKLPGLDAVSIGPDIRGAHSPDERASIPSTARFERVLRDLLGDLAGPGKS